MGTRTLVGALSCAALFGCVHQDFYPNGQLRREGRLQILSFDQVGEWTYYHKNGRLRAKGGYTQDVQTGFWTYWRDDGNKEMEGNYVRARRGESEEGQWRDGPWSFFHRDGKPRAQGSFLKGREVGPWTFWTQDGAIEKQGEYSDGRPALRWVNYRANGAKESEGYWFDGRHVGRWDFWDESGKPFQKDYVTPSGVQLVRETWEDGKLRREGFVRDGRQVGRWTTWHRNGKRRTSGEFTDGVATGAWMAWDADGSELAAGAVSGGRPKGEWRVRTHGLESTWQVDRITPSPPFTEWTPDDVTVTQTPEQVVTTWLAEASSEIEERGSPPPAPPALVVVEAPPPAIESASETKVEAPVIAQPYTKREEDKYEDYVQRYGLNPKPKLSGGDRYNSARRTDPDKEKGDTVLSATMVGKPLPVAEFRCADGRTIRIADYAGKKVLLVVLRGYASGVCVYCDAQTRALSDPEVAKAVAGLRCEVLLVYPGPENGWDAFLAEYRRAGSAVPFYPCLFDPELRLVRKLSIEGNQAIPSSMILDENGVVRFAYVGISIDDRPSAKALVAEIKKLCPNP